MSVLRSRRDPGDAVSEYVAAALKFSNHPAFHAIACAVAENVIQGVCNRLEPWVPELMALSIQDYETAVHRFWGRDHVHW